MSSDQKTWHKLMVRLAEWMTDERILATLSQELIWSHYIELLPIELPPLPQLRARVHQAIEHAREIAASRIPAAEDQP